MIRAFKLVIGEPSRGLPISRLAKEVDRLFLESRIVSIINRARVIERNYRLGELIVIEQVLTLILIEVEALTTLELPLL
jgi:hypothetical protein